MEQTTMDVIPSTVVLEVLNKYNYEDWSEVVKSYLVARNLWDVVTPDDTNDQSKINADCGDRVAITSADHEGHIKVKHQELENDKKNAAALHAIKISCGPEALHEIRRIYSAKEAWKTLEDKFKPEFCIQLFPREGESDGHDLETYKVFFNAIEQGNWDKAQKMYKENHNLLKKTFKNANFTALHYAVSSKDNEGIVKDMLTHMSKEDLERKESSCGWTALAQAIASGTPNMVEWMIDENGSLPHIEDNVHTIPIVMALNFQRMDLVYILYHATELEVLSDLKGGKHGAALISRCIKMKKAETIAIALHLLKNAPNLASATDSSGKSPVYTLACAAFLFHGEYGHRFWKKWIYDFITTKSALAEYEKNDESAVPAQMEEINRNTGFQSGSDTTNINSVLLAPFRWLFSKLPILSESAPDNNSYPTEVDKRIGDLKLVHKLSNELLRVMCTTISDISDIRELRDGLVFDALFAAVDRGNITFVDELTGIGPLFAASTDEHSRDIYMRAIEFRQDKLFTHMLGYVGDRHKAAASAMEDKFGNNLLHIVAGLAPPTYLNRIPGAALQMQRELQWFEEVKRLLYEGASTAENKDGNTPKELFTKSHKDLVSEGEKWMKEMATSCTVVAALIVTMVFTAAFTIPGNSPNKKLEKTYLDSIGIAFFSSTASVLVFLGILTARYDEDDFLVALPTKLFLGLSTLFISIASMLIAFCAGLLIMMPESWVRIPVITFAALPVILFVYMQFPLLIRTFRFTYLKGLSLSTVETKGTDTNKND